MNHNMSLYTLQRAAQEIDRERKNEEEVHNETYQAPENKQPEFTDKDRRIGLASQAYSKRKQPKNNRICPNIPHMRTVSAESAK